MLRRLAIEAEMFRTARIVFVLALEQQESISRTDIDDEASIFPVDGSEDDGAAHNEKTYEERLAEAIGTFKRGCRYEAGKPYE